MAIIWSSRPGSKSGGAEPLPVSKNIGGVGSQADDEVFPWRREEDIILSGWRNLGCGCERIPWLARRFLAEKVLFAYASAILGLSWNLAE